MSELSITNPVTYHSQRDNPRDPFVTCNVTSIATVLFDYGERPKKGGQLEDELYEWIIRNYGAESRTDHNVLESCYRAYGYPGSFSTTATWEQIKNWLLFGKPVVIAGVFAGLEHIVVAIGFDETGFIIHDPFGDARTNYKSQNGNHVHYSYSQMEQWQCKSGDTWAHFISPKLKKTDSIVITQDTFLKRSVLQSSDLPEEMRLPVKKGDRLTVKYCFSRHRNHYEMQFETKKNGYFNWLVFAGHCSFDVPETPSHASANLRAFLRLIRECEGTGQDPNGYRMMFTNKLFHSFADHPRQLQHGGGISSDAAGAYQFLSTTWDMAAEALKLPDFSPPSQDAAAVWLIGRRGALEAVKQGRLKEALDKCSYEWASLPPGRYGQPIKTYQECEAIFRKYGGIPS